MAYAQLFIFVPVAATGKCLLVLLLLFLSGSFLKIHIVMPRNSVAHLASEDWITFCTIAKNTAIRAEYWQEG